MEVHPGVGGEHCQALHSNMRNARCSGTARALPELRTVPQGLSPRSIAFSLTGDPPHDSNDQLHRCNVYAD